jgi:integrase
VQTALTYCRRLGLLPRLTSDDIADGLLKLKAPPKRIDYRKPRELQRLLDAALRHDADCYAETRAEHKGEGERGSTAKYTPIAPVVVAALMTGMRVGHLLDLDWRDVDLEALDENGDTVGEIVPQGGSNTKRTGVIGLEVSPALRKMLAAMKLSSGGRGKVFRITRNEADAALRRLAAEYAAPQGSTWQAFRRTCGCYLTNSPGIFGAASAYRSAKQLGHSVAIAEKHYVGLLRGIPREARTLEAAMQIEAQIECVIAAVGEPRKARALRAVGTD